MKEMTYTSILMINDQEICFGDLTDEEKAEAAGRIAKMPLEELGSVQAVKNNGFQNAAY